MKTLREFIYNYKIVQFSDGKFGIRRGWFNYTFYDFISDIPSWWSAEEDYSWYIKDCRTSYETAKNKFVLFTKGVNPDYEITNS